MATGRGARGCPVSRHRPRGQTAGGQGGRRLPLAHGPHVTQRELPGRPFSSVPGGQTGLAGPGDQEVSSSAPSAARTRAHGPRLPGPRRARGQRPERGARATRQAPPSPSLRRAGPAGAAQLPSGRTASAEARGPRAREARWPPGVAGTEAPGRRVRPPGAGAPGTGRPPPGAALPPAPGGVREAREPGRRGAGRRPHLEQVQRVRAAGGPGRRQAPEVPARHARLGRHARRWPGPTRPDPTRPRPDPEPDPDRPRRPSAGFKARPPPAPGAANTPARRGAGPHPGRGRRDHAPCLKGAAGARTGGGAADPAARLCRPPDAPGPPTPRARGSARPPPPAPAPRGGPPRTRAVARSSESPGPACGSSKTRGERQVRAQTPPQPGLPSHVRPPASLRPGRPGLEPWDRPGRPSAGLPRSSARSRRRAEPVPRATSRQDLGGPGVLCRQPPISGGHSQTPPPGRRGRSTGEPAPGPLNPQSLASWPRHQPDSRV